MRAVLTSALFGVSFLAIAAPALAQETASDAPSESVADIVVTAQRREQRLQEVPIAVSVITGDQITRTGALNIENAQYLVPSLNFRKSGVPINQTIFLRGIGTSTFSLAGEPSVSAVVDGVVLSRAGEAFTPLVDIERIEVLRGPQGTLFGKNSSAGVINIVTKRPGDEFGGEVEGGFFFDNGTEYRARAAVDLPLGDSVRTRLTGFYANWDGNIINETYDRRVNGYEQYGLRGLVEIDISDKVDLTLIADWRKSDDDCCAEVIAEPAIQADGSPTPAFLARAAVALPPLNGDETRRVRNNLINRSEETAWGLSAELNADLGMLTLTSITAYRSYDNREIRDGDFLDTIYVGIAQVADDGPQTGNTFTQEFRLTSPGDQRLDYVLGAFYSRAETERTFTRANTNCSASTLAPTPPLTPCSTAPGASTLTFPIGTANFGSTFTNFALFGHATYDITDRFRAIAGLRYTVDQLDVFHIRTTPVPGASQPPFDSGVFNGGRGGGTPNGIPWRGKATAEDLSGTAGLQFDLTEDNMAYATYARGYKGPAFNVFFNLTTVGTPALDPENADSFEIGLKNSMFDGRLILNVAGYYAKYYNFQANNPDIDPVTGIRITRFTNAGTVSTRGFELDLIAQPIDDLSLTGGLAYTDARVDAFRVAPGAPPTDIVPSGTPLAYAPKWKASLTADYRIRTNGFADIELGFQGSYQSSQLALFVPSQLIRDRSWIQPYALFDATIGLVDQDDRFKLSFIVRNLFDTSFAAAIADGGPLSAGNTGNSSLRYIIPREADRSFGLLARFNF
jgi:iron complex outermembrane receptor protein